MDTSPASEDSTATLAVSGVITGLAIITVALRFFVRIRMKTRIQWDDWFILIAMLVTLLEGGLILAGTIFYFSPHVPIWRPFPHSNLKSFKSGI